MANGGVIGTVGQKIVLNRSYKSSPDYTVASQFRVGTGTTTPTVSNTQIQTPATINGGTYKNFVTSYPVLDEVNMEATIRCYLDSSEANGNSLTEVATFNTDAGTVKLLTRDVHTAITKNNTTEVAYIIKNRIY